jgi:uncharacterized protein (TIGR03118 family)
MFLLFGGNKAVKYRIVFCFSLFFLFGFLSAAANVNAQTVGYRQTNLASDLPNMAHTVTPNLVNPWGIAFLPGQPFFIADNKVGRVTVHDISGSGARPIGFTVPNADSTRFDTPTGIVADQNSFFGGPSLVKPFILVAEQGTIFTWGPDSQGDLPETAKLVVDNSLRGAVYKGAAILNSLLTAPALVVTNFHDGSVDAFLPGFRPVALPGSFTDPNLPADYAPFGIQVIGNQVFVSYAVQDAAKRNAVFAPGNGIVSIFDMDGNFVRRFIAGGVLNGPWGTMQASGNFGPFSNDILIANVGDGTINAFDLASGEFRGQIKDGDGNTITNEGIHGLAFRTDGFGDSNTLYFTAGINNEQNGLLGTITTGLVSTTRLSIPPATTGTPVTIRIETSAGTANPGTPTGLVVVQDGSVVLSSQALVNGAATFDTIFTTSGSHAITVRYSGDASFLASSSRTELQVLGLTTTLALAAPATAAPNSTVILTATIASTGGVPTGQILFLDGTTGLGTASLDDSGVATLRVNTLAVGVHSLSVSYSGDEKFSASTSAAVTLTVANPDFSFNAIPATATVIAGQSTQFMLTVTPTGGFANNVTFSCSPVAGITCAFAPAAINPANGIANTTLTVTTSSSVPGFGFLLIDVIGPCSLLFVFYLFSLVAQHGGKLRIARVSLLSASATVAIVVLGFSLGGCGGYGSGVQANRRSASILVIAQSGAISHTATVKITVQ